MPDYAEFEHAVAQLASSGGLVNEETIEDLVWLWTDDYRASNPDAEIVSVAHDNGAYLFDIAKQRLIGAWAISEGKHTGARDSNRMRGHPLGGESGVYHRGHSIAHTLGGQLDINLVPQLGSMNIGEFRELERQAVATPGALYFSNWVYEASGDSQIPLAVWQGFAAPGEAVDIRNFSNRQN